MTTEESGVLIDRKLLIAHVTILFEIADEIERVATFDEGEMEDLVFFAAYAKQAARTFRRRLTKHRSGKMRLNYTSVLDRK